MRSLLRLVATLSWVTPVSAGAVPGIAPLAPAGARAFPNADLFVLDLAIGLMLLAIFVIGFAIVVHRRRQRMEQRRLWSWMLVPVMLLGVGLAIAGRDYHVSAMPWSVPTGGVLEIKITAHQGWWEYEYRAGDVRLTSFSRPAVRVRGAGPDDDHLILPEGRPVRLLETSTDAVHPLVVPELGIRADAMPGYVTETRVTPDRQGTFRAICEGCAASSPSQVVVEVVSQQRFDGWLARRSGRVQQ